MRVHVADRGGGEPGVVERELHARGRAFAAGRRRGDVVRVGVAAVADDLAVDVRTAGDGAVPTLEHERRRAFAHHESVAVGVERPRRVLGIVVAAARARSCAANAEIAVGVMHDSRAARHHDVGARRRG